MAEILGAGGIEIVPVFTQFDALLQAKVAASLAAVEKQFATVGGAGAAGGISTVTAEAGAAANVVNQKLTPALNGVTKGLKDTEKAAAGAGNGVNGLQKSFATLVKLAPVIAAAFSVKLFGDFEKAAKQSAVVFGDSADEIVNFAKNIDTQFGLTSTTALRFAADFGNALINIGFSQKTAAAASEELTKRTADVAAAQGQSTAQIAKAFQLAIEGNARGLKQLGITISATDQANRAAALGFKGTTAELSDAQRAAVFYSLVLEKTAKFQGQAAATADDFAGRLRDFKATVGDAAISIGQALAPAVEGLLGLFTPLAGAIGHIPPILLAFATAAGIAAVAMKTLSGSAIGNFITGLFAAEGALATLIAEMTAATGVAETLGVAFDVALGPIGIIAGAIGLAAAAFVLFQNETESTSDRIREIGDASLDTAGKFKALTDVDLHDLINDLNALSNIKTAVPDVTPTIAAVHQLADAGNDLDKLRSKFQNLLDPKFGTAGLGAAQEVLDALTAAGQGQSAIAKELQGAFDKEVAARRKANDEAQRGSDILNADTAVREQNEAQIKAQTAAITDLFKVSDQLDKARRVETEALEDQAAAQKKLDALRKENGAQEILDAQTKVTDATNSHTAAIERQAEAQKALDDLNAEDFDRTLAEAADAVTEAEIGVAKALRARDAALKALNKTQTKSIDLTHLSLDQLRTTLANARATLAAQRSGPADEDPAVLQENAVQAEIDLRKAKNQLIDVQKIQNDLIREGKNGTDEHLHLERELTLAKNATSKAQEEVNKRQAELDKILAGNSQFAKDLLAAIKDVRTETDKVNTAQQTISDLVAQQKDDTAIIKGDQITITEQMRQQVIEHAALFASDANLRRTFVESTLAGLSVTQFGGVPLTPNSLTPGEIDRIFAALKDDPNRFIEVLKFLGLSIPGHASGAVITRPELAFIGEKFKAESVIPWSRPDRVWEVLSQSLPHMPTTVRQRLEPVIPGASNHQISAATHLNTPVFEIDYKALGREVAKAMKEAGVGGGDVHVHPTPGMDEARLARKVARETNRYRGMP